MCTFVFICFNLQLQCLVSHIRLGIKYCYVFFNVCICRSPDRNLGRSGICLGQIGILFWPRQIPDLPKVILGQIRIPIWLGRFRICLGQMGIFDYC